MCLSSCLNKPSVAVFSTTGQYSEPGSVTGQQRAKQSVRESNSKPSGIKNQENKKPGILLPLLIISNITAVLCFAFCFLTTQESHRSPISTKVKSRHMTFSQNLHSLELIS